jgi:hypothetical protein
LERLGRTDEALDLCREVQSHKPTDETVLSTLVLIYKQTGQTREATQCYEGTLFMYIYLYVCVIHVYEIEKREMWEVDEAGGDFAIRIQD